MSVVVIEELLSDSRPELYPHNPCEIDLETHFLSDDLRAAQERGN
jgi:hypothetical protein